MSRFWHTRRLLDKHHPPKSRRGEHWGELSVLCHRWRSLVFLVTLLAGCMAAPYRAGTLNSVQPGWSREQFLHYYGSDGWIHPVLRAAKTVDADTIQVYTMPLQTDDRTDYWFVFKNSRLVQWGQPNDWKAVSATYQIDFTPSGVKPPI